MYRETGLTTVNENIAMVWDFGNKSCTLSSCHVCFILEPKIKYYTIQLIDIAFKGYVELKVMEQCNNCQVCFRGSRDQGSFVVY